MSLAADGDCCTDPLRDLPRLRAATAWMNAKSVRVSPQASSTAGEQHRAQMVASSTAGEVPRNGILCEGRYHQNGPNSRNRHLVLSGGTSCRRRLLHWPAPRSSASSCSDCLDECYSKSAVFLFIITYILDPLASMDCWLDFMRYLSFAMSLTRCLHSSFDKAFIWSQPPWMILFQSILCTHGFRRREPPLVSHH